MLCKCTTAHSSAIWQHAAHTTTNLLLLASKQEPHNKAYLLMKNMGRIFWKKFRRMDQQAEKKDWRERVIGLGRRTREEKNKRGDSKVESNDSPGIPDRGDTSNIPGLPSRCI